MILYKNVADNWQLNGYERKLLEKKDVLNRDINDPKFNALDLKELLFYVGQYLDNASLELFKILSPFLMINFIEPGKSGERLCNYWATLANYSLSIYQPGLIENLSICELIIQETNSNQFHLRFSYNNEQWLADRTKTEVAGRHYPYGIYGPINKLPEDVKDLYEKNKTIYHSDPDYLEYLNTVYFCDRQSGNLNRLFEIDKKLN